MIERPIRKSIPTRGAASYWELGWMYLMPDFDNPDNSIVEWRSTKAPVYPEQENA